MKTILKYLGLHLGAAALLLSPVALQAQTIEKLTNAIPANSDTNSTWGRIPTGTNGKGDDYSIAAESVIKDGDTYKMWYAGHDGATVRVYYATSTNGLDWLKYTNAAPANSDGVSSNGCIPTGTAAAKGDGVHAHTPCVIKDGALYKMWYSGSGGGGPSYRIYYATSPDGLVWTKSNNTAEANNDTTGTQGRLPLGSTAGRGDTTSVNWPSVIKDGDTYRMWYVGGGGSPSASRIYLATSPDGLTWTKVTNVMETASDSTGTFGRIPLGVAAGRGDTNAVTTPCVIKNGMTYLMWYAGHTGNAYRIYHATSTDGLTWTKKNNVLPALSDTNSTDGRIATGTSTRGDDLNVVAPCVVDEGSLLRFWYRGDKNGTPATNRIYSATWIKDFPTIANTGASNLAPGSVLFMGNLVATGQAPTTVRLYWGAADAGLTLTNWDHAVEFPGYPTPGPVSTNLALSTEVSGYYRFFATNQYGSCMADAVGTFAAGEVNVTATDAAASEFGPDSAAFTLFRPAAATSAPLTVYYTLSGSATNGVDYVAIASNVTFTAGAASKVVTITPIEDVIGEGLEDVTLTLAPGAYAIGPSNVATVTIADEGALNVFTNAGGGWDVDANWSLGHAPTNGELVKISANVTLSNSTAVLGSYNLPPGRTNTFAGTNTVLTVVEGLIRGVVTHGINTDTNSADGWQPDNKVQIEATNLTIASGGAINVDSRGYQGAPASGQSSGYGPGAGGSYGGGSHGGRGTGSNLGPIYDSTNAPTEPGSGGGKNDGFAAGAGGGVVRLLATGTLNLNGVVTANGQNVANSSAGAGGSIWITCGTIGGTGGVLRANGGSLSGSYGGHGGGGRLAVNYTAVAPGTALAGLACDRGFKGTAEAERGTIHLPDSRLLATNLTAAWNGLYYGFRQWSPPSLTLTNSEVTFQETNFVFAVTNDLTLIGSLLDLKPLDMTCGGNLFLTNTTIGSTLHLRNTAYRSGSTNYGAMIGITGTVTVAASCWIYPYSMNTNGASCYWQVGSLAIDAGGGIDADGKGWASSTTVGSGPGWGAQYGGGSHGGQGGKVAGGGVYDSSNTPMKAGSGGGGGQPANNPGGAGGGLIAMNIGGAARISGTVTANGNGSTAGAGGAGGGICLQADTFDVAFGTIRANGGAANAVGGSPGGGGGGRIAMYSRIDNFGGTVSAGGGTSGSGYPGATGTVVRALTAGYLNLTIAGSPTRHGTASPLDYGANGGLQGDWVTNRVNSPADESNGVRYVCLGWTLKTDSGTPITNDSTTEAIFQLNTNVVLTWLWTNQFYLTASANTNGSLLAQVTGWYTNGTPVTLTAVTNSGYDFLIWSGTGVPAGSHTNDPLTVTMNQPRTIQANFASQTPGMRVWSGTGDWLTPTNWSHGGVPGRQDSITIASGTASIIDPTLFNAASLTVSGALRVASADFTVDHDVLVSGASAYLLVSNLVLRVGGNVTLTNGGDLHVYGGSTNGTTNTYAALVDIAGDLAVASNGWVYPYSHPIDGGSPWFRAANVAIQQGGGFDADGKGCAAGGGAYEQFWVPGKGRGWGKGSCGGSYGGQGGYQPGSQDSQGPGGGIYGDSNAPVHCGSGGGGGLNGSYAGAGGGLVHLEVANRVNLEGTITAKGQRAVTQSAGGGSGGGIYIRCLRFVGSTNGALRVDGGDFAAGIYTYEGGGGGGRLAVWSTAPGSSTNDVKVRYSAAGGAATTYPGQPGTIVWGGFGPTGTSFMIR